MDCTNYLINLTYRSTNYILLFLFCNLTENYLYCILQAYLLSEDFRMMVDTMKRRERERIMREVSHKGGGSIFLSVCHCTIIFEHKSAPKQIFIYFSFIFHFYLISILFNLFSQYCDHKGGRRDGCGKRKNDFR